MVNVYLVKVGYGNQNMIHREKQNKIKQTNKKQTIYIDILFII